jgi:hypothetical protein
MTDETILTYIRRIDDKPMRICDRLQSLELRFDLVPARETNRMA